MSASVNGAVVFLGLLLLARFLGAPLIIGLLGSLAFGSTAIVTIGSLGGASPLIYTCFGALLLVSVAARKQIWRDLGMVFARFPAAWLVCALGIYAAASAIVFPRLFAGQTSAFVPSRMRSAVLEVPLEPVSANISQTGYLLLSVLIFIAFCIVLTRSDSLAIVRRGFFTWCVLNAAMGAMDVAGKFVGLGDILEPIRTASYAMLTDVEQAGFSRIAGAYSEASAFGAATLACLAFTLTYWRKTQSSFAFLLSAVLLVLLVLSTSSTAYAGALILSIPIGASVTRSLLAGQLSRTDILLIALTVLGIVVLLFIYLFDPRAFDPFVDLIQTTLIDKPRSASGQERAYWNYKSLQSLLDTDGLGVGMGSSRPSSWVIAVLSQLGIVGTVMFAVLLLIMANGLGGAATKAKPDERALASSVRACALAGIVSASLAGGSADPGVVFFVSLAVIANCRERARARDPVHSPFSLAYGSGLQAPPSER
jgi:hypothetical protein